MRIVACIVALMLWAGMAEATAHKSTRTGTHKAVFAAGQFWHAQATFDAVPGVVSTVVGYAGGDIPNPTYHEVASGQSGHYEAVEITYDPNVISYERLLHIFWRMIDPTDGGGQFCHRGAQYRAAIFFTDAAQYKRVMDSRMLLDADSQRFGGREVLVPVLPLHHFYAAEDAHQRYYRKNALRYGFLDNRCGRAQRLRAVWGR